MAHLSEIPPPQRAAFRVASIWNLIPVIALIVFGALFLRHIATLERSMIWSALGALSPLQWMAALFFTALSFRAIGTYDVLVHKVLNTGLPPHIARMTGIKAIALSQTLGFGAVTSALVRWRCLPDVPVGMVMRLSLVVSVSFLAALAGVAGVVVPLSGLVPYSGMLIIGGIIAIASLAALAKLAFKLRWIPKPVRGRAVCALMVATAADTGFAAAALWMLWPETVSLHLLFAAYLVALGAGLMSNAPGGMGAFDLTFLMLLPVSDDAAAVTALLAFRMIYYALPASIALASLVRPSGTPPAKPLIHPEAALLAQSATAHPHSKSTLLTLPCWGAGAVFGDLPKKMTLHDLRRCDPKALYKCSPRQAVAARRAGWRVLRCAKDALLNPQIWSLDGPNRRQLRRALKIFHASDLQIAEIRNMDMLCDVADAWAQAHGGERGLSMGQFCPQYLRQQRVFVAFKGDIPQAFVSFHTGDTWTLDLMRHLANLPARTMHALVCTGIGAARDAGATHLSLAAVPDPDPKLPFAQRTHVNAAGLMRFKSAFAPDWQARYICATSTVSLGLTMATLAYGIHRPAPLHRHNSAQTQHEDYSIAPLGHPCDPRVVPAGASPNDQCFIRSPHHA